MKNLKENKLFKWYLERKNFISKTECDAIINKIASSDTLRVQENGHDELLSGKFVPIENEKLTNSIYNVVKLANDLCFKFNIKGVHSCYGKEYFWKSFEESKTLHCDMSEGDITDTTIKLTTILFLNDNYDGGELQIWDTKIKPEIGKLIIFPSFAGHRVNKFTNNNRYVLVTFIGGDYFA